MAQPITVAVTFDSNLSSNDIFAFFDTFPIEQPNGPVKQDLIITENPNTHRKEGSGTLMLKKGADGEIAPIRFTVFAAPGRPKETPVSSSYFLCMKYNASTNQWLVNSFYDVPQSLKNQNNEGICLTTNIATSNVLAMSLVRNVLCIPLGRNIPSTPICT